MIYELKGISVDSQRIVFAGVCLEDNRTLNDHRISKESTLHFVCIQKSENIDFKDA